MVAVWSRSLVFCLTSSQLSLTSSKCSYTHWTQAAPGKGTVQRQKAAVKTVSNSICTGRQTNSHFPFFPIMPWSFAVGEEKLQLPWCHEIFVVNVAWHQVSGNQVRQKTDWRAVCGNHESLNLLINKQLWRLQVLEPETPGHDGKTPGSYLI